MDGASARLVETMSEAAARRRSLCIRAGGTKDFYGNPARGDPLDPREHCGIVNYDPAELVITARAGTALAEIERRLDEHCQMLGFEPPHFGQGATLGGCVAAGLSGPRASFPGAGRGSVRDFVLGATLVDGRGRLLTFGGTVIKNVAGYDMSRVLAGSLGILGVMTQLSLRVVPRPSAEVTLRHELDERMALDRVNEWAREPLPITGSAWEAGVLAVRLSGPQAALNAAHRRIGGEMLADDAAARFWRELREQTADFFAGDAPLWRLSVPATAAPVGIGDRQLVEGGGAIRWVRSGRAAAELHRVAAGLGGLATLFRGGDRAQGVFAPLPPAIARIHAALKAEFDPAGILNPGRLVPGL